MEFITFYKLKKQVVFLLLFTFSVNGFSQKIESFSEDTDQFLVELDAYLNKTQNDEVRKISKQIQKSFKKGEISISDQKLIRNVSNLMLESKMKVSPYFKSFLQVVLQLSDDEMNKQKLSDWVSVCENIVLNSSSRKLLKYCEFTTEFLNTKTLRNSKSVKWFADFSNFDFKDEEGVPFISFNTPVDLSCSNRNGEFHILNTTGKYWISTNSWEGKSGLVNWLSRGISNDSVYAILSDYYIDVRESQFKADSVIFYNKLLFSDPILGVFSNKALSGSASEHFPVFKSYKKDIMINNILPDVDYKGGYTLRGRDFIADGRGDASARMVIKKNGKEVLVASSTRFSINKNVIYSKSASIKIYFDEDSICHPSLEFTYDQSDRKLKLYRDMKGVSGAPIYNSYH
ncbi:MAG: hypothetical protein QNK60_04835, partial [Flavobacteriales bacterium]